MDFSRAALTAAAGVDPWALAEQVYSARPEQVRELGRQFRVAGAKAVEVAATADAADDELAAAFLNYRWPVHEKVSSRAATRRALADDGELMEECARIAFGVADGLDQATDGVRGTVTALEAEVDAVIARRSRFMTGKAATLTGLDLKTAEAGFAHDAVAVVRSYGRRVQALVDGYEALLVNHTGRLAGLGYPTVGQRPRTPLDEIESTYQVSEDLDGSLTVPGGPTLLAGELAVIALLLGRAFGTGTVVGPLTVPAVVADLEAIQRRAGAEAVAVFPVDGRFDDPDIAENHTDAFRHAYWNALLTRAYGEQFAAGLTVAHERSPDNNPVAEAMDLFNNEVGRRIAVEHPHAGPAELARLVEQAVRDGQTVVVADDHRLAYSDSVALGDTGDPLPADAPPGAHPAVLTGEIGPDKHAGTA